MPALRPAPLWALLALWLCRAAPARGEYPTEGCCPRLSGSRPSGPAGHLGRPFPSFRPPLGEKAGLGRRRAVRPLSS